eukprot:11208728-Lingulodinium_polyedra.AAC.1
MAARAAELATIAGRPGILHANAPTERATTKGSTAKATRRVKPARGSAKRQRTRATAGERTGAPKGRGSKARVTA